MKIPRHWPARLTVAAIAPVAAAMLIITPASAMIVPASDTGTACSYVHNNPLNESDTVNPCVTVLNGHVFGELTATGLFFRTATLYVLQCRLPVSRSTCRVIAANHQTNTDTVRTSVKYAPWGHVFRACASYTDSQKFHYTNFCSPFRAWR
jgi:hypothetical protein